MTVESYRTRQEAEGAAERLRGAGIPVTLLHTRIEKDSRLEHVWEVVIPHEYARFVASAQAGLAKESGLTGAQ